MVKVAINGFGRIGRALLKLVFKEPRLAGQLEIVAINDLGDVENLAYLLKYDTAYGRSGLDVKVVGGSLIVNGKEIKFIQQKDPTTLPWKDMGVDIVVESSGVFDSYEKAKAHLVAGAKRVVITAPVKDLPKDAGITGATILLGINDEEIKDAVITSNASCTTNAAGPVMKILNDAIGIEKALLNTTHAMTATQAVVDSPTKGDYRRGRAASHNLIPASTGAAIAISKVIKGLDGVFDGIAIRVPMITGSLADITFISKRNTTREEINDILRKAASDPKWKNIYTATDEEIVSSDIIGLPYASIADLTSTKVVGGNLVKVLAWYDNEMGYTNTLADHVLKVASFL
ncbi:MAG: type I glyceraldehyde-3-phosphate dehydrogenase [Candidatus Paceibacterota bacterium]|jgi:glyceraldehyde 3-phosphate dehydrogenase